MTKVEQVRDIVEMAAITNAGSIVLDDFNGLVSRATREVVKQKQVSSLGAEEVYEHIFMVVAAFLKIRADANGNGDILLDWEKVIKGPEK